LAKPLPYQQEQEGSREQQQQAEAHHSPAGTEEFHCDHDNPRKEQQHADDLQQADSLDERGMRPMA
jgi:hypothetical protein